jgi:hypothetical protein
MATSQPAKMTSGAGKLFPPEPDEELLDPRDVGRADDLAGRDAAFDFLHPALEDARS